jgi:ribosomal protein L30/L7E
MNTENNNATVEMVQGYVNNTIVPTSELLQKCFGAVLETVEKDTTVSKETKDMINAVSVVYKGVAGMAIALAKNPKIITTVIKLSENPEVRELINTITETVQSEWEGIESEVSELNK